MNQLISVVIPNFNKAAFLRETLDSLLSQSYQDWEAIIVDDGSTDQSKAIIELYAQKDERLVPFYLEKQEHGGAACRNLGMNQARGEYVMFFDSDDVLLSHCLSSRVRFISKYSDLDFAVFGMESFDKDINEKGLRWIPKKADAFDRFLSHDLPWAIMQPLYRTDFLRKNSITWRMDISRMQDVFFHTDCLTKNPKFEVDFASLDCKFRIDPNRTVMNRSVHYKNWVEAVKLYYLTYVSISEKNRVLLDQMLIRAHQVLSQAYIKAEINEHVFLGQSMDLATVTNSNVVIFYFKITSKLRIHIPGFQLIALRILQSGLSSD